MAGKYRKHSYALFIWVYVSLLFCVVFCLVACGRKATPRPDGYFRIEPYPQSFRTEIIGAIAIQVNDSARSVVPDNRNESGVCWMNVAYPRYHATLYLSYFPVTGRDNLDQLLSESKDLVYRQNVNTSLVGAIAYENQDPFLSATVYTLSAESATPLQFVATDSVNFLLRGVLYYDTPVRTDSVAPTLSFLQTELMQIIESITPVLE